jgi:HEAT repeat protein
MSKNMRDEEWIGMVGDLGDKASISMLTRLANRHSRLRSVSFSNGWVGFGHDRVPSAAVNALGCIDDPSARAALLQGLVSDRPAVFARVLVLVGNSDDVVGALNVLRRGLSSNDIETFTESAAALVDLGGPDDRSTALAALWRWATEEYHMLTWKTGLDLMIHYGDAHTIESARAALRRHLSSPTNTLHEVCAMSLGAIGGPADLGALAQGLGKPEDAKVYASCARALIRIGGPREIEMGQAALREGLNHPDPFVRRFCLLSLSQDSAVANIIAILHQGLRDSDKSLRVDYAAALGRIGEPAALQALQSGLEDPYYLVRLVSAEALARSGDPVNGRSGLEVLREGLSHEDARVRQDFAEALLRICGPNTIETLRQGLLDPARSSSE